MADMQIHSTSAARGEFVIVREFNASRDLVYAAWTEPARLMQWWGPKGFTMLSCTLDLRPGGVFHYGMRAPNGGEVWGKWTFEEVSPPERLVFIASFSDADCGITRHPMSENWPLEMHSTLTLEERGEKTLIIMRGFPVNATDSERKTFEDARDSLQVGWTGTLDQLDQYLASALTQ